MKTGRLYKVISILIVVFMMLLSFYFFVIFDREKVSDFQNFEQEVMSILTRYDSSEPSIVVDSENIIESNGRKLLSTADFQARFNAKIAFNSNKIVITRNNNDYEIDLIDNTVSLNGDRFAIARYYDSCDNDYVDVELVADVLGYEISFNQNNLTLHKKFANSRLIIKSKSTPNKLNAVATTSGYDGYYIYQFASCEDAQEAYDYYKQDGLIEWVEEDYIITTQENTDFESYGLTDSFSYGSWGADDMGVEDYSQYLLAYGQDNLKEVVVAVLDTGIDTDHPWFTNRIYPNGKNYSDAKPTTEYEYEDVDGHGSHVSGTIVDLTLPNVKILPIKVMDDTGKGSTSSILLGIKYVCSLKDQGVNVYAINMSLGAACSVNSTDFKGFTEMIGVAYEKNILSVVAAGNEGVDVSGVSPANVSKAITVAAIGERAGGYYRPSWSNYGSYIDIAAPGVEIISAVPGANLEVKSGTSMAAPHIAGVIALLCSAPDANYSVTDLENLIITNAIDLGNPGKDAYFGYGLLNVEYAYAALIDDVVFSVTDTDFDTPFNLELSSVESGVEIYYTTDGSVPSLTTGIKYVGPITVDKSMVVKAVCYVLDGDNIVKFSRVCSCVYTYNQQDVDDSYVVTDDGILTEYTGILTEVKVPEKVKGITIVAIGKNAFAVSSVKKVYLADTINDIQVSAFEGCSTLNYIKGKNVQNIDMYAFNGCTSLTTLTDIEFPSLKTIGKNAFYHCNNLNNVNLSSVEFIDSAAFAMDGIYARFLKSISFANVEIVESNAFYNCQYLTSAYLPKVKYVCSNAFYNCDLSLVDFPECEFLGNSAFRSNTNIVSVLLPKVKVIGGNAFNSLGAKLTTLEIANVNTICANAFSSCTGITYINAPLLEYIGSYAFYKCSRVNRANISNVEILGVGAFEDCTALTDIQLNNVREIKKDAFASVSLSVVTLSPCIEIIDNPFTRAGILFKLYSGTIAEDYAIANGYTYEYIDCVDNVTYDEYESYIKITGVVDKTIDFNIPSYINDKPVKIIGENAFKGSKIKSVNLPNVITVESGAFENCDELENVKLINVESIGDGAFKNCTSLKNADVVDVQTIGNEAFYNTALTMIKLNQVLSIGNRALAYDGDGYVIADFSIVGVSRSIAELYANSVNCKFVSIYNYLSGFYYSFYDNNGREDICVALVDTEVTGNIVLIDSYEGYVFSKIDDGAFANCSFITGVRLPASFEYIGEDAFVNCSSLEEINLENIKSIGPSAFASCYKLKSVDLSSLEIIYADVFYNCESLQEVYAPNVTVIAEAAFYNCYDLRSVVCPKAEQVMAYAFYNCYNLESIDTLQLKVIGTESYNGITGYSFYNCLKLKEVRLADIEKIGLKAFEKSGLESIIVGKKLTEYPGALFATSVDIYGYKGTLIEEYAKARGNNFIPIDELAFVQNLPETLVVWQTEEKTLEVQVSGHLVEYRWYQSLMAGFDSGVLLDGQSNVIDINTDEVGVFYYYVKVTDWTGAVLVSNLCEVSVGDVSDCVFITVISVANCEISPSVQKVVVKKGESFTFTFKIVTGYYINAIIIDGQKKASANSYTFNNLQEDHTLTLEILPSNTTYKVVHFREVLTNTIYYVNGKYYAKYYEETLNGKTGETTNAKYIINDESYDKIPIEQSSIASDGSTVINVYYDLKVFDVEIKVSDGVLYATGEGQYKYGQTVELYAKMRKGYDFVGWQTGYSIEYSQNLDTGIVVFTMPGYDIDFYANSKLKTHTLKVELTAGGTADIDGEITLDYNTRKTINIKPDEGYKIVKVLQDGQEIGADSCIVVNVIRDTVISVVFERIKYKITIEIDGDGQVLTEGVVDGFVNYGETITLRINPSEFAEIDKLYINDVQVLEIESNVMEIQEIMTDINVEIVFKDKVIDDIEPIEIQETQLFSKEMLITIAIIVAAILGVALFVGRIVKRTSNRL